MGWDVRPLPGLELSLRIHPLSLPQHPTAAAAAAADRARAPPRSRRVSRPAPHPPEVDGIDDIAEWTNTLNKLEVLGFADGQVKDMMRIVAAVLALGNVAFVAGDGEKHKVKDAKGLGTVASLLMVEPTALEGALTTRKVASGRGSTYTVPLNAQQCIDTRDALAKATYDQPVRLADRRPQLADGGAERQGD